MSVLEILAVRLRAPGGLPRPVRRTLTVTALMVGLVALVVPLLGAALLGTAPARAAEPLIVYGDDNTPPYEFLDRGQSRGMNVDLWRAIGERLGRPVEVRLTSWTEAQAKVLEGTGAGLTMLTPTPERMAVWAFSEPTHTLGFSLFMRVEDASRLRTAPLAGQRIGVQANGFSESWFRRNHPDTHLEASRDFIDGFRDLLNGRIDAFAQITASGDYALEQLAIGGIAGAAEPFATRQVAIPIPLANAALAQEVNRALAELRRDGSFERIVARWSPKPVHVISETGLRLGLVVGGAIVVILALLVAFVLVLVSRRRRLLREVERRRQAEDALVTLNASLEQRIEDGAAKLVQLQKMESLGRLTGGIAHDFNNLLQGVGSCLFVLDRHVPEGTPRALFDAARQSIERGAGLTQSLLAFARRQRLVLRSTDLETLLQGMRPLLERTLGGMMQVAIDVPAGTAPALADPHQLESALVNLAINARDAMPLGGRLMLRAAETTVAHQGAPGAPPDLSPGGYVTISVEDTGTGMDAATLARVFEPFFTTKEVGKGSGLGLSMVHGMAAQSGGGVSIASTPGQGTAVAIHLRRAPSTPLQETRAPTTAARGAGRRVLLVDDDDLVRAGTQAILEGLDYHVLPVGGGEAALDLLRGGAGIDALVTDYAMPGMNGAVLVREARRIRPALPAIMITGYASRPEGVQEVVVLLKPFRSDDLAARLSDALRPARSENVLPFAPGRKG